MPHSRCIKSQTFSYDATYLYTSAFDGYIKRYWAKNQEQDKNYGKVFPDGVYLMQLSRSDQELYVADTKGRLKKIIELKSYGKNQNQNDIVDLGKVIGEDIRALEILQDGSYYFVGGGLGSQGMFNEKDKHVHTIQIPGAVQCQSSTPQNQFVIVGWSNGGLKLISISSKQVIKEFDQIEKDRHLYKICCLKISGDGKWVCSGDEKGFLKMWNVKTQKLEHDFGKVHYGVGGMEVAQEYKPISM